MLPSNLFKSTRNQVDLASQIICRDLSRIAKCRLSSPFSVPMHVKNGASTDDNKAPRLIETRLTTSEILEGFCLGLPSLNKKIINGADGGKRGNLTREAVNATEHELAVAMHTFPNKNPFYRKQGNDDKNHYSKWRHGAISGNQQPAKQFLDYKDGPKSNLARQDQIIFSAILGCCSDSIQPLISSATTSRDAWERLNASYANGSRSRAISLKSKLVKNPKGTRSIAEYIQDMRAIVDDLALAPSPVTEDLLVHIPSQLGDDYGTIVAVAKVRETPLSYSELFDKLTDFERALKEQTAVPEPVLTTVNYNARRSNSSREPGRSDGFKQQRSTNNRFSNQQRNSTNRTQWSSSASGRNRQNWSNSLCQFCNISGHMACDCRKLARFLREKNVTVNTSQSNASNAPVVNTGHY